MEGKLQSFAVGIGDHDIGRLPQCAVHLEGKGVSRRHAILHVTAGEIVIEDLQSANGTFINGRRITGRHPIANGDVVQFGDIGFRARIV